MGGGGDEPQIPNDEIWYTSSDGNAVTFSNAENAFDVNTVSNTYSNGKGIIKFNGVLTTIGLGAFSYHENITSITIPNSVTSIGDLAFNKCTGITSVKVEATTPPEIKNIHSMAALL